MPSDNHVTYEFYCREMVRTAQAFLPLARFGFKHSVSLAVNQPRVIFDTPWCRFQMAWGGWDPYIGYTLSIYYGRSHAPNDKYKMIWMGEECYCWHRVNNALNFLDGMSPADAAASRNLPRVMQEFEQSGVAKKLESSLQEWWVSMHASIWEHYGQRLFELFSTRRPNLWHQYSHFLREYYETKGIPSDTSPLPYKIC